MQMEAITLDVFLRETDTGGYIHNRVWMSYEFPDTEGGTHQIGDMSMEPVQIAEGIVRSFGEGSFSNLFPRVVSSVLFHNGNKDGVKEYNGHNDEVLNHKLPQRYYQKIIDCLRSTTREDLNPRISYNPPVYG
ncbi:MAG TPA: hypothetical protein VMC80_00735 [Patescibacteria group bacterium]|nr:hypothetical protein [Patescibacteria group bacterium]